MENTLQNPNFEYRYSPLSILLHWLMAAMLVIVFATMELRPYTAKGSDLREALSAWHFGLGLAIFGLVWLRCISRRTNQIPVIAEESPTWQNALAKMTHFMLYGLMIGMPILGWLAQSAKGQPILLLGFEVPALIGNNESIAKLFKQWHLSFATLGYGLIALHLAAAAFHHYVRKDATLRRMLPGCK
jgi:cytochrome b561